MKTDIEPQLHTLLTVRHFAQKHAAFPEGGLRFLIFNSATNGFSKCLRRIGRKVLIDEALFFQIIEDQNAQQGGVK